MQKIKAEMGHRANLGHVELGTVVPLAAPYVLLIDPSSLCNHKCKFCPSGNLELIRSTGRYQGLLDFELYKKIIDDLKEYNEPIRVLRLYKEGEPLVNPKFPDMVAYAKQSGLVKRIDTTTNGALLNPELNLKLVEAGLDRINISVNGVSSEQIEFYTKTKVDFKQYVANIKHLYENRGSLEVFVKSIKENLSVSEQEKFYEIFGDISDRIFLENISPAWPDFEFDSGVETEFQSGNYGQDAFERQVCPYIFYIMVINADGRSSFCVGDWKHCLIAGDLKTQSVKEVWQGEILNNARLSHLEGRRYENDFCKACEVVTYGTLDNLDPHIDEIKGRMAK